MFAKKSLGQNFLKSKEALSAMISAGRLSSEDVVLEAGPGQGALTEKLLETAGPRIGETVRVVAVEKDDRLIETLKEKFADAVAQKKLEIVHGDILEFNPAERGMESGKYKILANIPYYITGQFFRKFLSGAVSPSLLVVMIQKEVADRIIARDGKESILSISVKAYGEPKKIMKVGREYFSPKPNVDSAIVLVDNISKKFFMESGVGEEQFFEIVHAGFAQKRKKLLSNLEAVAEKETLKEIFSELNIGENVRAENISIEQWKEIVKRIRS